METQNKIALLVKCPNCGNKFSPEDALQHDLRLQLKKEFDLKLSENTKTVEERVRLQEKEKLQAQFRTVDEDRKAKSKRLSELESRMFAMQENEQRVKDREEQMEFEMKKKLLEREKLIKEQAEKTALDKALFEVREREQKLQRDRESLELFMRKRVMDEVEKVREEERMRGAELQKKLDDQTKLIHEMKRRTEQGSTQTQGEVQELAIENHLIASFPYDSIEEICKGKRGGDCVHIVRDHYKNECGKILYESKRTKHFSYEWITKLKEDMRLKQVDVGVIVTEVFPDGMTRFGEIDGVWVCSFIEFKALALLFRHNLARIGEVMSAQENKGEKMQLLYSYLTSNEFKQKLEGAFDSFTEMQDDLLKEKAVMTSQWAKREKKLMKAMENLVSLYGDVRGIAGGAVQEIKSLEIANPIFMEQ